MPHYREILQQRFTDEYQKLNEKQRIAVDSIDGPVMVIAGPGTGKTQILAARIGKILLDTDALPNPWLSNSRSAPCHGGRSYPAGSKRCWPFAAAMPG